MLFSIVVVGTNSCRKLSRSTLGCVIKFTNDTILYDCLPIRLRYNASAAFISLNCGASTGISCVWRIIIFLLCCVTKLVFTMVLKKDKKTVYFCRLWSIPFRRSISASLYSELIFPNSLLIDPYTFLA